MKIVTITLVLLGTIAAAAQTVPLVPESLGLINVTVSPETYKGKKGLHVLGTNPEGEQVALLKDLVFSTGTIEVDVSGDRLPGTDESFRGFIGIAFGVQQGDTLRYQAFYVRPTNGRANDQLRRNHTTQYIVHPKYPWPVLRKDFPGVYESYADMVAGEWTHLKIVVESNRAQLFVNGAGQPCLVINDLKTDSKSGGVALWIGPGTDGYFSGLKMVKGK